MAKLKEERYIDENGIEMIREYFGTDDNHISAIVEKPIPQKLEDIEVDEPIPQDELNAEILLNQMTILENQAEQDVVLAEILLNQMGGE